jgi:orotidine-5'-phosphate decarboxylase
MINVGRAIAYSKNPGEEARKYQLEFNAIREKHA